MVLLTNSIPTFTVFSLAYACNVKSHKGGMLQYVHGGNLEKVLTFSSH